MNKKGFTLIELIPVILILSLAMLTVGMVVNFGLDTNKRQTIQNEVQENARRAIVDFTDNVRKGTDFINYEGRTDNNTMKSSFEKLGIIYKTGEPVYDATGAEGYQGVLFVLQINGQYCLYAMKDEEVYRFLYTSEIDPDSLFEPLESTESKIDENTKMYYYKNYKFGNGTDTVENFNFYQGSRYFHCYKRGTAFYIQELKKKPITLTEQSREMVADCIESVTVNESTDAYRFSFTVSRQNNMTGFFTDKTLETSVALVNYGGDEDED